MLIETGIMKHLVRQNDQSEKELYKDFLKRVKKQMKKHYKEEYVNLVPIRYGEDGFFF